MTLPKYTASMREGSMLAEAIADLVAIVPSSVEVSFLSDPPKAPNGVRFAATMKMLDMVISVCRDDI